MEEGAKTIGLNECVALLAPLFRAGIPVWLVGGAVRDALEKRPPRDFDFVGEADPGTLRRLLPQAVSVGGKIPTLVLSRGKGRTPLQLSGGEKGLLADLERRDFSMNAMAWQVSPTGLEGEILDPFGGREDLKNRRLRVPLASRDPFREDPVRVLRLMRFVATRGYTVEPATLGMARGAMKDLAKVAGERRLREVELFWVGEALDMVTRNLPEDFCGEALRAGIFGRNLPALPLSQSREAFLRAVEATTSSGLVRMWIFAWEAAGSEGGVETRWGRSLWGGKGGADLPLSRIDRHRLVTLDRLKGVLSRWPMLGPWDRRSLTLVGRDPSKGEVARLVARGLPEELRVHFLMWARQGERLVRQLPKDGLNPPRRRR